jgi:hypothetical protein
LDTLRLAATTGTELIVILVPVEEFI